MNASVRFTDTRMPPLAMGIATTNTMRLIPPPPQADLAARHPTPARRHTSPTRLPAPTIATLRGHTSLAGNVKCQPGGMAGRVGHVGEDRRDQRGAGAAKDVPLLPRGRLPPRRPPARTLLAVIRPKVITAAATPGGDGAGSGTLPDAAAPPSLTGKTRLALLIY